MRNQYTLLSVLLGLMVVLAGCTGVNTFSSAARSGDTVALGLGWQQDLNRNNVVSVSIVDNSGVETIYAPGATEIRAIFNNYPDPISNLVVGAETQQFIVGTESLWGITIDGQVTNGDRDWSETFMVMDLPTGMIDGEATINVQTATGLIGPIKVLIITDPDTGTGGGRNDLAAQELTINETHIRSLERAAHYTVTFNSSTGEIPHGIQIDMSHDPGVGVAYVANPRGDIKNINWTDDGTNLRVVLLPTRDTTLGKLIYFKFYVAGEISGLQEVAGTIRAFDINGNEITTGVITANIN